MRLSGDEKLDNGRIEVGGEQIALVPSRVDHGIYVLLLSLARVINRRYFKVDVRGLDKIPSPPYIIAPTHRSNIDSVLMGSLTRTPLRFMGKDSLWKARPIGRLLNAIGGIPVNRDIADRQAVDTCVAILGAGQPLVLFPEGTRKQGPMIEEVLDGAAYIALKAGVPIIPVGIAGSELAMGKGTKFPRPSRCVMLVGDPILTAVQASGSGSRIARSKIKSLTGELQTHLQELYDEAQGLL